MFKKWKNLQRSSHRKKSPTQIKKEDAFKIKLKGIFDIAHKHALKNISEMQKKFLKAQSGNLCAELCSDFQRKNHVDHVMIDVVFSFKVPKTQMKIVMK